jgi:hypothetical protein
MSADDEPIETAYVPGTITHELDATSQTETSRSDTVKVTVCVALHTFSKFLRTLSGRAGSVAASGEPR